jgi:hypothetical protein
VQRQLKLRIRTIDRDDWPHQEWLARFVRTLEVGQRRARRWSLRALDDREGRCGWEARADRADRTERLTLSLAADDDPALSEWTLTVESGPPEKAPATLRGGEWLLGLALGLAAFLVVRGSLGVVAGILLLLACGLVLPYLVWRRPPVTPGDEPDDVDSELLARVRRGAELFVGFEVVTPEWREPELP